MKIARKGLRGTKRGRRASDDFSAEGPNEGEEESTCIEYSTSRALELILEDNQIFVESCGRSDLMPLSKIICMETVNSHAQGCIAQMMKTNLLQLL